MKQTNWGEAATTAFPFAPNMKQFALFLLALLLLIVSEYYLLTEIFTRRRLPVMIGTLACVLFSVLVFIRFIRQRFVA